MSAHLLSMPQENTISLAQKIASTNKRYILLLGSGISRDSGIKSGWEITNILIREALSINQSSENIKDIQDSDLRSKYIEVFKEEPTFSGIFTQLNLNGVEHEQERRERVKRFFEKEDGGPIEPTIAHKIIAQLQKEELLGFIITTNFDDLMETALRDIGITPDVLTFQSSQKELSILPETRRIFKINGSYPGELKITHQDLSEYDDKIKNYLKLIFSEYGVITCGWSGVSDIALRNILLDSSIEHRYPIYYCHRSGKSSEIPTEIVEAGKTQKLNFVSIENADEFFSALSHEIENYYSLFSPQPFTSDLAVSLIENALSTIPKPDIKIKKLIERGINEINDILNTDVKLEGEFDQRKYYLERIQTLFEKSKPLASILATLVYYDGKKYSKYIRDVLETLITSVDEKKIMVSSMYKRSLKTDYGGSSFPRIMLFRRFYPALIVFYSVGVTAVKEQHYDIILLLLQTFTAYPYNQTHGRRKREPLTGWFCPSNIMTKGFREQHEYTHHAKISSDCKDEYNDFVNTCFQASKYYFSNYDTYTQYFDQFEALFGFMAIFNKHEKLTEIYEELENVPIAITNWRTIMARGFNVYDNSERYREEIPIMISPFIDKIMNDNYNVAGYDVFIRQSRDKLLKFLTPGEMK